MDFSQMNSLLFSYTKGTIPFDPQGDQSEPQVGEFITWSLAWIMMNAIIHYKIFQ